VKNQYGRRTAGAPDKNLSLCIWHDQNAFPVKLPNTSQVIENSHDVVLRDLPGFFVALN
jgi:hypothetical protein